MRLSQTIVGIVVGVIAIAPAQAQGVPLPAPPFPSENPPTETKHVLGKILFWDEQLSSDNTVACGTCHRPGNGGSDPDPTDTVLIDTDVPIAGQGFFYVKSVIDSGGDERGLGATSEGLAREVLLVCE